MVLTLQQIWIPSSADQNLQPTRSYSSTSSRLHILQATVLASPVRLQAAICSVRLQLAHRYLCSIRSPGTFFPSTLPFQPSISPMSSPLLSKIQSNRLHSVASISRGDSSPAPRLGVGTGAPAPRLGVGTGVGSPAPRLCVGTGVPAPRFGVGTGVGSPLLSGIPSAHNHFTINITNHPGATVDVGKLQDVSSAVLQPAPGLLPVPTTHHIQRSDLRPNDLRRSLLCRAAISAGKQVPDIQPALAPPTSSLPATKPPGLTTSAKRRMRAERKNAAARAQPANPGTTAAVAPDQMSALLLEVASLREKVDAQRQPSPAPADDRPRAPSSPPGPAPELFEDARLRLSVENRYYPLRAGATAAYLPPPSDARPLCPARSFQPLQDSDSLLRRHPPRGRSPRYSPGPPSHRRRLEWSSTLTPSDINGWLSPLRRGAAETTRSRSPPRGSRSSPQAREPRGRSERKRQRSVSPPRPAAPSTRVWRPAPAPTPHGCDGHQTNQTTPAPDVAAPPAPHPPAPTADSARDSVREALVAVVRAKETQWQGVHADLTETLLHRFGKSSESTSTAAEYLSKLDALRATVVNTLTNWKTSRHELAGSILDAFGADNSPSLARLDDLTSSLEVAFDGAVTRAGSPFSSTDEGAAASPADASPGPPSDPAPHVPALPRPEPVSSPPAAPTDPPAATALEALLGTASYVSGNEEFDEVHPTTASASSRAASPQRTDLAHRTLSPHPMKAAAATATSAPAPVTAPTRIPQPERLKLRRSNKTTGHHARARHYPQLLLVSTAANAPPAPDRHTGQASNGHFTPSPPRPQTATPCAEPAPPPVPKPRIRWPAHPT